LNLTRGEILEQLGRLDEAERGFREEIVRHPATLRAWVALAELQHERGESSQALATAREMRARCPDPRAAGVAAQLEAILRRGR